MKIQLKDESVNLDGLQLPMVLALWWTAHEYRRQGMDSITVTSARDGKHVAGSLHPVGLALDFRIWNLPDPAGLADRLRRQLDREYDVILEADHLHVEFDPKK